MWIKTEAEGKQGESPESDELQDHHLDTREHTDALQQKHNVDTTPQTWIDGEGIGGYEALREYFGAEAKDEDATSYKPVIAIFAISLLMGLAISWGCLRDRSDRARCRSAKAVKVTGVSRISSEKAIKIALYPHLPRCTRGAVAGERSDWRRAISTYHSQTIEQTL